jgi:hypothetical protein
MSFKKMDRVKVRSVTSRFAGEVGTVIAESVWVFGSETDICYLVDLDSGSSVTCDDQDLVLTDENDE